MKKKDSPQATASTEQREPESAPSEEDPLITALKKVRPGFQFGSKCLIDPPPYLVHAAKKDGMRLSLRLESRAEELVQKWGHELALDEHGKPVRVNELVWMRMPENLAQEYHQHSKALNERRVTSSPMPPNMGQGTRIYDAAIGTDSAGYSEEQVVFKEETK